MTLSTIETSRSILQEAVVEDQFAPFFTRRHGSPAFIGYFPGDAFKAARAFRYIDLAEESNRAVGIGNSGPVINTAELVAVGGGKSHLDADNGSGRSQQYSLRSFPGAFSEVGSSTLTSDTDRHPAVHGRRHEGVAVVSRNEPRAPVGGLKIVDRERLNDTLWVGRSNGKPRILVAAQPTRGLDVGATEYVRDRIIAQRASGMATLLFSEDLDEVFALSDRIAVIFHGEIMGIVTGDQVTTEELGLMMAGERVELGTD